MVAPFKVAGPFDVTSPNQAFASVLPGPNDCVYRPTGVRAGNIYTTFSQAVTAIKSFDGFNRQLSFDDGASGNGFTVPAGNYVLGSNGFVQFVGRQDDNGPIFVTLHNGVVFDVLPGLFKDIDLELLSHPAPSTPWTLDVNAHASNEIYTVIQNAIVAGDAGSQIPLITISDVGNTGGSLQISVYSSDIGEAAINSNNANVQVNLYEDSTIEDLAFQGTLSKVILNFFDFASMLNCVNFFNGNTGGPIQKLNRSGFASFYTGDIQAEGAIGMVEASINAFIVDWSIFFQSSDTLNRSYTLGGSGGHTSAGIWQGAGNANTAITILSAGTCTSSPNELDIINLSIITSPGGSRFFSSADNVVYIRLQNSTIQADADSPFLIVETNISYLDFFEVSRLIGPSPAFAVAPGALLIVNIEGPAIIPQGTIDPGEGSLTINVFDSGVQLYPGFAQYCNLFPGIRLTIAGDPITLGVTPQGPGCELFDTSTRILWIYDGTNWYPSTNEVVYSPGTSGSINTLTKLLFVCKRMKPGWRYVQIDLSNNANVDTWATGTALDFGGDTVFTALPSVNGVYPHITISKVGVSPTSMVPYNFKMDGIHWTLNNNTNGTFIFASTGHNIVIEFCGTSIVNAVTAENFFVAGGGNHSIIKIADQTQLLTADIPSVQFGTNGDPGTTLEVQALGSCLIQTGLIDTNPGTTISYLSSNAVVSGLGYSGILTLFTGIPFNDGVLDPINDAVPVPPQGSMYFVPSSGLSFVYHGAWKQVSARGTTTLVAGVSPAIDCFLTATSSIQATRKAINGSTAIATLAALAADRVNGSSGAGSFKITSLKLNATTETNDVSIVDWLVVDNG